MTVDSTHLDGLKAEVTAAWAGLEAPPPQDMEIMDWEYGEDARNTFVGVRPVNVDIDSVGFRTATPLLALPDHAAAAYLGPYLLSLLQGFQIEEAVGFPVDVKTRSHTLFVLAFPGFWTDIASPHLSEACVSALGKVLRFIVEHNPVFLLSDDERQGLERLLPSVDQQLNPPASR